MGFRDGLKKGGGFLNNVDGRVVGYEFSNIAPGGNSEGEWLYLVPSVRVDGADKDVTQHLFMGGVDNYEVSEDGKTAWSIDKDGERYPETRLGADTPAGLFLGSLADKGGAAIEALLPDLGAGEPLNFEKLFRANGVRVRFTQEKDEKGTSKRGKRIDKKTKKEYDRTNTVISAVYDAGAAPAGKTGPKGVVKPGAKAAPAADENAVAELAQATVLEILGNQDDGEIAKPKIRVKLMQALGKNPLKDDVIKFVFDDEKLAAMEGVSYDPSDKKQIIRLAA